MIQPGTDAFSIFRTHFNLSSTCCRYDRHPVLRPVLADGCYNAWVREFWQLGMVLIITLGFHRGTEK